MVIRVQGAGLRTNRPGSKDEGIEHRTSNVQHRSWEKRNRYCRSAAVFRLASMFDVARSMFAFESLDFYVQESVNFSSGLAKDTLRILGLGPTLAIARR